MIPRITLSADGPSISRLVAGCMKWGAWGKQLSPQDTLRLVEQCLEIGLTTFDHADIYGHYTTEADFGRALALQPSLRDQIELVSKCGIRLVTPNRPENRIKSYDTSKEYILWSVDQSLRALQTDRLELLLIHRPSPLMDPHEIAEAFTALRAAGKVLHFGVSNFTPSQFAMLYELFPLVTNQVRASVRHLDPFLDGVFDQAQRLRLAPMAWSPLGGGGLFELPGDTQARRIHRVAEELGEKYGLAFDQLLIAWLLCHPAQIVPVLGSGRFERIQRVARAFEVELEPEDWFRLWQASTGEEVP